MSNFENWLYGQSEFEFIAEPEDISPADCFEFESDIAHVFSQIKSGNDAAWFCAHVIARHGNLEGHDYLGGCSYGSFAEFKERGGYFDDMKWQAVHDLALKIYATN